MSSYTWNSGTSGLWASTSNWSPTGIPDGSADTAQITAVGTNYLVTIASGETRSVNQLTLGNTTIGVGAATPTLEVAGTLRLAGSNAAITFAQGELLVDNSGLLDGAASGLFFTSPAALQVSVVNFGTIAADGGSGTSLQLLGATDNLGTLLASNGILQVSGISFNNLQGGTLTGGSYIVTGPASGTFNEIEFGGNFSAPLTTDAATIVLDGTATDLSSWITSSFQTLEQQLQTIAVGGALEALDGRGYITSNALTDNGVLDLQGGKLATGGLAVATSGTTVGGMLSGFGVVTGSIENSGFITATGGALDLQQAVGGTGELSVAAGSSLILSGATPGTLVNNGIVFQTSGLLDVNALTGSGTLVVQNGATIDLNVATNQSVVFTGSNATLVLGTPLLYGGTLSGFGLGDSLVLNGVTADSGSIVGGNTLALIHSGATVDTVQLAGNYSGAGFAVSMAGSSAVVTNTGGAPLRDDMPVSISVSDSAGLSGTQQSEIVNDLSAAAADWGQYVTGHTTLRIQLNIQNSSSGSELANAGPGGYIATGQTIGGYTIYEPNSIYALTTGNYEPSTSSDIIVNLPADSTALSQMYINPDPFGSPTATGTVAGQFDLLSVFRHEVAHGLGFIGIRDATTGALGADATLFDTDSTLTLNGGSTITAANFIGSNAEAAYGAFLGTTATPVPLTLLNNGEAFFHVANSGSDPLAGDLMSGVGLSPNTSRDISSVDLAILTDVGLPVTAGIVCFARGTRIATPDGEVPVEALRPGDQVRTVDGTQPVVWVGRRRIDCARHPAPRRVQPVCIRAHAFGPDLPRRDLWVSPQHAIYVEDVLIPARCLLNGSSVTQVPVAQVEYFHVELPRHDLLLAEGLASESYLECGDRGFFDNGGAPLVLHPDLFAVRWESAGAAPLKLVGPEVEAARRRLAARAHLAVEAPAAAVG